MLPPVLAEWLDWAQAWYTVNVGQRQKTLHFGRVFAVDLFSVEAAGVLAGSAAVALPRLWANVAPLLALGGSQAVSLAITP